MVDPLRTQGSYLKFNGKLDYYRSGAEGEVRNQGDVRKINGFDIDVSGTPTTLVTENAFQPGKGIHYVKGTPPQQNLSSSTMGLMLQMQDIQFNTADLKAVMDKESPFDITVTTTGEVSFQPTGAEPQSVEGLGFIPGDVFRSGNIEDYRKSQLSRNGELANIEAGLRKEYGADVKLAFDPLSEEYIMLRPGQAGYDNVSSAADVFARSRSDLKSLGYNNTHAFDDILNKYEAKLHAAR